MKTWLTSSCLGVVLFISTAASPSSSNLPQYDPSGTWNYEMEIPEQRMQIGVITIEKENGQYQVTWETDDYGTLELEDVEFDGMDLTASVEVSGGVAEFEVEFDGDSMQGTIYFGEDELPISAERE